MNMKICDANYNSHFRVLNAMHKLLFAVGNNTPLFIKNTFRVVLARFPTLIIGTVHSLTDSMPAELSVVVDRRGLLPVYFILIIKGNFYPNSTRSCI